MGSPPVWLAAASTAESAGDAGEAFAAEDAQCAFAGGRDFFVEAILLGLVDAALQPCVTGVVRFLYRLFQFVATLIDEAAQIL